MLNGSRRRPTVTKVSAAPNLPRVRHLPFISAQECCSWNLRAQIRVLVSLPASDPSSYGGPAGGPAAFNGGENGVVSAHSSLHRAAIESKVSDLATVDPAHPARATCLVIGCGLSKEDADGSAVARCRELKHLLRATVDARHAMAAAHAGHAAALRNVGAVLFDYAADEPAAHLNASVASVTADRAAPRRSRSRRRRRRRPSGP
ncbi:hypothetical protein ACP70R_029026 [Stipagrostis hirtigluma subsp. patula]